MLGFFPILVAVHIWATEFANAAVKFWCDNLAVVHIVNRQTSKSPKVMQLVRALVQHCLTINTQFIARHVPGVQNSIADALSRFQGERFRLLAPEAGSDPEAMPQWLWTLGSAELKKPYGRH